MVGIAGFAVLDWLVARRLGAGLTALDALAGNRGQLVVRGHLRTRYVAQYIDGVQVADGDACYYRNRHRNRVHDAAAQ
jgi:hypothetical protein